ncbi:MAG TPA: head-tail connector protein [Microvirga sp.]|nr:head-tail connector protein [Microvirga sp.]
MAALITKDQAKQQLRIDFDDQDADLEMKIEQASEIVIDYLKRPDHGWTETTVPKPVQAAILLVLTALWDDRDGHGDGDYLAPDGPVARLLTRFRDPALA